MIHSSTALLPPFLALLFSSFLGAYTRNNPSSALALCSALIYPTHTSALSAISRRQLQSNARLTLRSSAFAPAFAQHGQLFSLLFLIHV